MDDSTEFAHYKVTIPDNYWKVVDEARNQYHDSSNTDPDSGKFAGRTIAVDGSWGANLPPWATSTYVEPRYVESTAAICVDYSRTPNTYDWRTTKPTPPTVWDKLFLFLTGRS